MTNKKRHHFQFKYFTYTQAIELGRMKETVAPFSGIVEKHKNATPGTNKRTNYDFEVIVRSEHCLLTFNALCIIFIFC